MKNGQPHLYLLGVHDIDRQVESPQHHVAVAIAVMWRALRGGVNTAVSVVCPTRGKTCTCRARHGGLRWGTLHQVDYLPIYI